MEEYLKTVLEQIRCKQARGMVEAELRDHLEEQISENLFEGMSQEEAAETAVKDMGNPVEVGISMDALHRPQMSWSMVILIGAISILSIILQTVIGFQDMELGAGYALKHGMHVALGFAFMLAIYRLDYSFLGKYGKRISGAGAGLFLLLYFTWSLQINGHQRWISIPGLGSISVSAVLYLWIPLYAGILYQYYGKGIWGVLKSILWMFLPAFLALRLPDLFLAGFLLITQAIVLSAAVANGWFQVKKSRFLLIFWSIAAGFPVVFVVLGIWLQIFAQYQIDRILAYIAGSSGFNFWQEWFHNSRWLGKGETIDVTRLGNYYSDYIFTFLSTNYGIAAAVLAAALVLTAGVKCCRISFRQKNQLGMLTGFAVGVFFLSMTVLHIMLGMGIVPYVTSFLPFLSSGGSNLIISYGMLGFLLSIYRYKDILPADKRTAGRPSVESKTMLRATEHQT